MNPYIGHASQLYGVEEHRLVGGKGDGMRLLEINNGIGLELTSSPDRNGDISRLRYKGINMSYFSPCGYVSPAYYDRFGSHWLNSFTAGYLTTCGLQAVGSPCVDNGEELSLHGSIANQPCDHVWWTESDSELIVHTNTTEEAIFGRKFVLSRELHVSLKENMFSIQDTITNNGDHKEPFEILYHMNMGYPLLDEDSIITIPSDKVVPRNEHAAESLDRWMKMEKPTPGYEECCYYHTFSGDEGKAFIFQPKLGYGLEITYDSRSLDGFVEWKMMGMRDYVLGLECGNCYPDGRDVMRKTGMLKFLDAGESIHYQVNIRLFDNK